MEKQNIFLIGFMGTGKSTIAAELSRRLGMERMEMDTAIAEEQGMSINDIFKEYGEAYFRDLESKLLTELQKKKGMVVSCGGGTVLRSENVQYMKKSGMIVLLGASPETIYRRGRKKKDRPIFNHKIKGENNIEMMGKKKGTFSPWGPLFPPGVENLKRGKGRKKSSPRKKF